MARQKFTVAQISEALRKNDGMVSTTAETLDCDWSTVWRYLKRYPSLEAIREEARETLVDIAESRLRKLVEEDNLTAIIFALKCLGKERGYIERQEITKSGTSDVEINIVPAEEKSELTPEQRQKLLQGAVQRVLERVVANSTLSSTTKEELTTWLESDNLAIAVKRD